MHWQACLQRRDLLVYDPSWHLSLLLHVGSLVLEIILRCCETYMRRLEGPSNNPMLGSYLLRTKSRQVGRC